MKSPYGRENTTPSLASNANSISVNGVAYHASYRIPASLGYSGVMDQPRVASASAMGMQTMYGGHNSISLDGSSASSSSSRKRPLDALSPLPSPLLSFLSTPSSGPATLPSPSNMVDLSLRFGSNPSVSSGLNLGSNHGHATAAANSLKFVVPVAAKRVRRDSPSSPRSVGDVSSRREPSGSATTTMPLRPASALPPPAPSASTDKIRSVVRGLEHVSRCPPSGCGNPLCVSTRGFMNKVSAHLVTIAGKPGHQPDKCGACVLWQSIVRSHTTICMEAECTVPLCPSGQKHDVASLMESSTTNGCRRRDRRDDNDDQRHPMIALK